MYFVCAFYVSICGEVFFVTFLCLPVCEYIHVFVDSDEMWHFPVVAGIGSGRRDPEKKLECPPDFSQGAPAP